MALDRATVSRIRSAQERYEGEKAKGVITKLELEVMASRLGQLYIRHGYDILRILEAHL